MVSRIDEVSILYLSITNIISFSMLAFSWFSKSSFRQIDLDCEFLERERIMDYSLLVGIHFRNDNTADKFGLSPFLLRTGNLLCHGECIDLVYYFVRCYNCSYLILWSSGKSDSFQSEKFMRGYRFLEAELQDMDRVLAGRYDIRTHFVMCNLYWLLR